MDRTPISTHLNRKHQKKRPDVSRVLLLLSRSSYRAEAFVAAARCLDLDLTVGSNHHQALADLTPGSSLILDTINIDRSVNTIVQFALRYPLSAIVSAEDDFTPLAAAASDLTALKG